MSEYEAFGRSFNTNSFLIKPEWNACTTTTTTALEYHPYRGEVTGGSAYVCEAAGLPGMPHLPRLGNRFHGIGAGRPNTPRIYADNCATCGVRIVNRFIGRGTAWDGWRPSITVAPSCVIQEDPF